MVNLVTFHKKYSLGNSYLKNNELDSFIMKNTSEKTEQDGTKMIEHYIIVFANEEDRSFNEAIVFHLEER